MIVVVSFPVAVLDGVELMVLGMRELLVATETTARSAIHSIDRSDRAVDEQVFFGSHRAQHGVRRLLSRVHCIGVVLLWIHDILGSL